MFAQGNSRCFHSIHMLDWLYKPGHCSGLTDKRLGLVNLTHLPTVLLVAQFTASKTCGSVLSMTHVPMCSHTHTQQRRTQYVTGGLLESSVRSPGQSTVVHTVTGLHLSSLSPSTTSKLSLSLYLLPQMGQIFTKSYASKFAKSII